MRAVVDETTVQREEKFQHFYNFEDERRTIFLRFSYSSLYLCSRIIFSHSSLKHNTRGINTTKVNGKGKTLSRANVEQCIVVKQRRNFKQIVNQTHSLNLLKSFVVRVVSRPISRSPPPFLRRSDIRPPDRALCVRCV